MKYLSTLVLCTLLFVGCSHRSYNITQKEEPIVPKSNPRQSYTDSYTGWTFSVPDEWRILLDDSTTVTFSKGPQWLDLNISASDIPQAYQESYLDSLYQVYGKGNNEAKKRGIKAPVLTSEKVTINGVSFLKKHMEISASSNKRMYADGYYTKTSDRFICVILTYLKPEQGDELYRIFTNAVKPLK